MWLDNLKLSAFPSPFEGSNVSCPIGEVDFNSFSVFLLTKELAIVYFSIENEDKKSLIGFGCLVALLSKINAIFIFFDEGSGNCDSAELIERKQSHIDSFWA